MTFEETIINTIKFVGTYTLKNSQILELCEAFQVRGRLYIDDLDFSKYGSGNNEASTSGERQQLLKDINKLNLAPTEVNTKKNISGGLSFFSKTKDAKTITNCNVENQTEDYDNVFQL